MSRELSQEAQVVLEEQPKIVDAVFEHRDALDPHAKRPAGDLLGVVADVPQYLRMHHARAQDLEPAALLAEPATGAAADEAQHVHLGRRLREREERRPEADPRAWPEHLAREQLERALQIRHG